MKKILSDARAKKANEIGIYGMSLTSKAKSPLAKAREKKSFIKKLK